MPQGRITTTRRKVETKDDGKTQSDFNALRYQVGGTYSRFIDYMNDCSEHFTNVGTFKVAVDRKHMTIFSHLLECYEHHNRVEIVEVEIQRTGFNTIDTYIYPQVASKHLRIIAVLKERGTTGLDFILNARDPNTKQETTRLRSVRMISEGLYVLPMSYSHISISSGNTIEGSRMTACKAIYVNFVVKTLSDIVLGTIADRILGVRNLNSDKKVDDVVKATDKETLLPFIQAVGESVSKNTTMAMAPV